MATFVIQEVTSEFLTLLVTRQNGSTFVIGVREDQLQDGTPVELKKQLRQIVRETIQFQKRNKPKLMDLAVDVGVSQDDSAP